MEDWQEREAESDRVTKMYEDVEDEIIALLVAAWATGLPETVQTAALTSKTLLTQAQVQTQVWESEAIPELYGPSNILSDVTVPGITMASEARFNDMTATASRRIDDLVRDFNDADARRMALGLYQEEKAGLSVKELAATLEKDLAEHGIPAFTDAAGRKWRLSVYADMAARTTTMDAQLSGNKDRFVIAGKDLVRIVGPLDYPDGCPPAVLNGPYSLTGLTPDVMTLDAAVSYYGVFHPRCRHSIVAA